MKNLRSIVIDRCDQLNKQWNQFPARKQRKWVIVFFTGYLLLTAIVVLTVWHDAKTEATEKSLVSGHIRNPVAEKEGNSKDTLTTKNQDYERR